MSEMIDKRDKRDKPTPELIAVKGKLLKEIDKIVAKRLPVDADGFRAMAAGYESKEGSIAEYRKYVENVDESSVRKLRDLECAYNCLKHSEERLKTYDRNSQKMLITIIENWKPTPELIAVKGKLLQEIDKIVAKRLPVDADGFRAMAAGYESKEGSIANYRKYVEGVDESSVRKLMDLDRAYKRLKDSEERLKTYDRESQEALIAVIEGWLWHKIFYPNEE